METISPSFCCSHLVKSKVAVKDKFVFASRRILQEIQTEDEAGTFEIVSVHGAGQDILFRDPSYYKRYSAHMEHIQMKNLSVKGGSSPSFNQAFMTKLLEYYLAFLTFWTIFASRLKN